MEEHRNPEMGNNTNFPSVFLIPGMLTALTGCDPRVTTSTTGENNVKTVDGLVQVSGFLGSLHESDNAARVSSNTKRVKSVDNSTRFSQEAISMQRLEATLWVVGTALILLFFGTHAWGEIERQWDVAAFSQTQQSTDREADPVSIEPGQSRDDTVLAILRIAGIDLELPVRYGTDERILRRGPGLIEGTAVPGSDGNVAIAAHRDRHFRGLKDLKLGDLIELETDDRTQSYVITDLSVVEPTDVHVLEEIGQPVITLVTCYPFYFVGNAPNRFIVRAEAAEYRKSKPRGE